MKKFFYKTSLLSGLNFSIINGMNIEFKSEDGYSNPFDIYQQNLDNTSDLNNNLKNLGDTSNYIVSEDDSDSEDDIDSKEDIYSGYKNILGKIISIYKNKSNINNQHSKLNLGVLLNSKIYKLNEFFNFISNNSYDKGYIINMKKHLFGEEVLCIEELKELKSASFSDFKNTPDKYIKRNLRMINNVLGDKKYRNIGRNMIKFQTLSKLDLNSYIYLLDYSELITFNCSALDIFNKIFNIHKSRLDELKETIEKYSQNNNNNKEIYKMLIEKEIDIDIKNLDSNIKKTFIYFKFVEFKKKIKDIYNDFVKEIKTTYQNKEVFEKISKKYKEDYVVFYRTMDYFINSSNNFKDKAFRIGIKGIEEDYNSLLKSCYNNYCKSRIENVYRNVILGNNQNVDPLKFVNCFLNFNNKYIESETPINLCDEINIDSFYDFISKEYDRLL